VNFLNDGGNPKVAPSTFPRAILRNFVKRHVVGEKTRISSDALETLDKMLDEVAGWIIRESEKMAS
jgi:histone H3/H4